MASPETVYNPRNKQEQDVASTNNNNQRQDSRGKIKQTKQKQRVIRRVGRRNTEDLGPGYDPTTAPDLLMNISNKVDSVNNFPEDEISRSPSPIMLRQESKKKKDNTVNTLDRLQMAEQARKQDEIVVSLRSIHKRIRKALVNNGFDPQLESVIATSNEPPKYDPRSSVDPKEKFKTDIDDMILLLHKQEISKNALIQDVDDFLRISEKEGTSDAMLDKALTNIELQEKEAGEGQEEIGKAVKYTKHLANRMQRMGEQMMREIGVLYSSDEDDESDSGIKSARGQKGDPPEVRLFNNPAAFANNTSMFLKSLQEMVRAVKTRGQKQQVKIMIKQYKAQIMVTEQWLADLKKREDQCISLMEQARQLKLSRDNANKSREEADLKKKFYERKVMDLNLENQKMKSMNEAWSAKYVKVEGEISKLQHKIDSLEDQAMMAKEFGKHDKAVAANKAQGKRRVSVQENKGGQAVESMKEEIRRLTDVIADNQSKILTLEKELIAQRGVVTQLRMQLKLSSRDNVNVAPPDQPDVNLSNSSALQLTQVTEAFEKAKFDMAELRREVRRKNKEIAKLENQLAQQRKEMMNMFIGEPVNKVSNPVTIETTTAAGTTAPATSTTAIAATATEDTNESVLEKEDTYEEYHSKVNDAGSSSLSDDTVEDSFATSSRYSDSVSVPSVYSQPSTQAQVVIQQKMIPASQLSNVKKLMRAMTIDHEVEIKKLVTHLENEKSRWDANIRRQEQAQKEQLVGVHKQVLQVFKMINHFKSSVASLLDKQMLHNIAGDVRRIQELNADETTVDTKMLNQMSSLTTSVFVTLENSLSQAFLASRVEAKEKVAASQAKQKQSKNTEVQGSKQQKHQTIQLMEQVRVLKEQLQVQKEDMIQQRKREEQKYQMVYRRYSKLWGKYTAVQKDMDRFQKDFVEALCSKERELDDMKIARLDSARQFEEQKRLATKLQHKINSRLENWEEHVSLCAENLKDNLKILHKATKENKISVMVNNLTVDVVKQLMDIPLLRLKSLFKRYIKIRHFQAAKEEMERRLQGLPEDDEHMEIIRDNYTRYMHRVQSRLERRSKLWHSEMNKLEDVRRAGWNEFLNVWKGDATNSNLTGRIDERMYGYVLGLDHGDMGEPSPRRQMKTSRATRAMYRSFLPGIRLPNMDQASELIGRKMTLLGGREDMWNVGISIAKRGNLESATKGSKGLTTPRITEIENTKHLKFAHKTLENVRNVRTPLTLLPSELYDYEKVVPRPISRNFHESPLLLDQNAGLLQLPRSPGQTSKETPYTPSDI